MRVIVSVAVSVDGFIDDATSERLVLSCEEDWAQVRRLRADCDAILIGGCTLRCDKPSLNTKPQTLRDERLAAGQPADLIKVVVSRSGDLDSSCRFFSEGDNRKIIITDKDHQADISTRFDGIATVLAPEGEVTAAAIVDMLSKEGVESLLVEGGAQILDMFLDSGYVEQMRMAVCSKEVGSGVRFLKEGVAQFVSTNAFCQQSCNQVGNMKVYTYDMRSEDRRGLMRAVELAAQAPASNTAYSVGAVIVTAVGEWFEGYSRKTSPINHAEEEAINAALAAGADLRGATIYSSMEPCSTRSSKPLSCSQLILQYGFSKVVFAVSEPETFVRCTGASMLRDAGVEVVVMNDLVTEALKPNRHIVG